ncbi:UNVERIFIED_CONTAM: hypothetical protein GTU68_060891 [Idotea baltica]|nr:hypothetical protein [Idotea baltica]
MRSRCSIGRGRSHRSCPARHIFSLSFGSVEITQFWTVPRPYLLSP